jgi:hypothetical protein
MSDYDTDIPVWSEHQAELLRRRGAGELINDTDLDWSNIAEEIEAVGRSELHAVTSLLTQALTHMLKAEAWPLARDVPHWQAEARRFRGDAADGFVPSMRQRIDLARVYRRARCGRCPIRSKASRRCRCLMSARSRWTNYWED